MVTIVDVAKAAGVSTATVSHVINRTRYVKEEKIVKVTEAIERLGYIPNVNATSLRSGRTKRIGFLVPEIGSFFSVDIMKSVEEILGTHGYQIILGCSHEDIEIEKEQIDIFNYQQIDGLLMFPAPGNHEFLNKISRNYPIVFIDRNAENCKRDLIIGDNENAMYDVTKAIIAKGHKRIAIIQGVPGVSSLIERENGYKKALIDSNIQIDSSIIRHGESTCDGGYRETKWLIENTDVTAIIALTSSMTLGCLRCLKNNNIGIPTQMAVVCFGESDWAEISDPPLTTMKHPLYDMGNKAAQLLLKRIREKENGDIENKAYQTIRMPIELIERKTL